MLVLGCSDPAEPSADDSTTDGSTTSVTDDTEDAPSSSGPGGESSSDGSQDDSSGEPPPVVDCTDACADTTDAAGVAICYACRCRQAMDGWLPSHEELQCSQADEIVIYRADLSGAAPELVPVDEAAPADCANPSLLTWSCQAGSRLGRIEHDDVSVRWICRDPYDAGGERRYADVGSILHNRRTGATCWFDDNDEVTGEDDFPDLDLEHAGEANLALYLDNFYYTEGDYCTECHDNDPFIYTPYLRSLEWLTGTYALGPYALVRPDGVSAAVSEAAGTQHLVGEEVAPCTQCHRISSAGSCDFLVSDSMGLVKEPETYEPAILDATDPESPAWTLAYWMPGTTPLRPEVPPMAALDDWLGLYAAARDRIVQCCEDPGVDGPGCTWEPIPGGG